MKSHFTLFVRVTCRDLPWLASFFFGMTLAAFAVLGDLIGRC